MHNTIQHWLTLLYGDTPAKAKTFDTHEYLKEELIKGVKAELLSDGKQLTTQAEVAEFYADGCNILDHVHQHYKDWFPKSYKLVGVEVPLEIDVTESVRFRGYIDVVLFHKATKTIYIYDFKTSRAGWYRQKKDPKKTDQLLLYKKYYAQVFGVSEDNIKVEFIILKRKISENTEYVVKHVAGFEPSHGKISMKRATERFDKFISLFDSTGAPDLTQIKATPSEAACKYCPFSQNAELCAFSMNKPIKNSKLSK